MTPYSILNLTKSKRVVLYLSSDEKIRYKGEKKDIQKLIPYLKEHRGELIRILKDETVILQNLADIGETDQIIIDSVLDKCRLDRDAKQIFMDRNTFDFTLKGCINDKTRQSLEQSTGY